LDRKSPYAQPMESILALLLSLAVTELIAIRYAGQSMARQMQPREQSPSIYMKIASAHMAQKSGVARG